MEAQTRLLRVLQQGEYTTVGGRTPIKADVRIIAATNKDLRILIQQGLFREDLFFRLNVVPLRLPPLRERIEDVPDLIRHFFAQAEREGLPPKQLDQAGLDRLKRYRWPGNVRELENLARRLAALYPQEVISAAVVDAELSQPAATPSTDEPRAEDEGLVILAREADAAQEEHVGALGLDGETHLRLDLDARRAAALGPAASSPARWPRRAARRPAGAARSARATPGPPRSTRARRCGRSGPSRRPARAGRST